jgi:SpoVK/Ycf46/Vps4 family AAA+-type ATPase
MKLSMIRLFSQVVNCGELLSKWVGESTKNIEAIFEEVRFSDAILVFDEAEGLFGSRTSMTYVHGDRYIHECRDGERGREV